MAQRDAIAANIERVGWAVGRTLPLIKDPAYSKAIRDAVAAYRVKVDALAKETPYAVPYKPDIWGAGWNIQRFGWDQWMLHLSFPDLFPRTYALQALSFILGVHPGSNTASFVSGVGANSLTTAYGFNRADWSYIPGGSASGTALIRPDFPGAQDLAVLLAADRVRAGPRHHRLSTAGAGGRSRAEPVTVAAVVSPERTREDARP